MHQHMDPGKLKEIQKMVQDFNKAPFIVPGSEWFLAGGALVSNAQRTEPKDYDFFCKKDSNTSFYVDKLPSNKASDQGFLFQFSGKSINLITKTWGKVGIVVGGFDFNHCKIFLDSDGDLGWFPECESPIRNMCLQLNPDRVHVPFHTLCRISKFLKRGYSCSPELLEEIKNELHTSTIENLFDEMYQATPPVEVES